MIEPTLEAVNLTAVFTEGLTVEGAFEAPSLFIVRLIWLPDPCPKFIACKTCKVRLSPKMALLHAKKHGIVLSCTQQVVLADYL